MSNQTGHPREPTGLQRGFILAASSSNAGKTTLSLGLQRLLLKKGHAIAPAKCGPDYIDPAFHQIASNHQSINLDPWAMTPKALRLRAQNHAANSDILFIEGVMGLFDGAATGAGSTASLAECLNLPIILILDVKGQAQTAAAIAQGIMNHNDSLSFAGIMLNRVGSKAHEALLREAFQMCGVPILGYIRNNPDLALPSRHLGLVQAGEHAELDAKIDAIADHMAPDFNLKLLEERLLDCQDTQAPPAIGNLSCSDQLPPLGQHIAIAKDEAFSFIYPHILNDWRERGASLSFFSPLKDEIPAPDADAIYLPGGYPELHLPRLASARNFREALAAAAKKGTLIFGECGGYMTLGREIIGADGNAYPMLNLLPLITSFEKPKLSLGYRQLIHSSALPWNKALKAHEFHYATTKWRGEADPLFAARNASGKELKAMGMQKGNVMGSFAHIIAPSR